MQTAISTLAVEKAIPKKRWIRIIPPVVIVYIIAYMDRVNIGFAMAGGMNEALGLSMADIWTRGRKLLLGISGPERAGRSHCGAWQRQEIHPLYNYRLGWHLLTYGNSTK